jgi:hypothetical protein
MRGIVGLWLLLGAAPVWAGGIYLGDPAGRAATLTQQRDMDRDLRRRIHEDHEIDRRVYGINPPADADVDSDDGGPRDRGNED